MKEDISEELAQFERSKQIKNLIEVDRVEVIKNIEKAQESQLKIQNARTKPTEEVLKTGTKVLLKNEGINGKLEPKFQGPFTVVGQSSGGNYKLNTADGKPVLSNYPITKLKPILDDEDKPSESVEIEKILGKRKNESIDQIEYLVKWKGLNESENEWVPVNHFDDLRIVNEYNKKINKLSEQEFTASIEEKRGRGRPRKDGLLKGALTTTTKVPVERNLGTRKSARIANINILIIVQLFLLI